MQKLNYDLNYAISIRGKTFNEIGWGEDNPRFADKPVTFFDSIAIAELENDGPSNMPLHYEVLGPLFRQDKHPRARVTKKIWKQRYHNYRLFYRECYLSHLQNKGIAG